MMSTPGQSMRVQRADVAPDFVIVNLGFRKKQETGTFIVATPPPLAG